MKKQIAMVLLMASVTGGASLVAKGYSNENNKENIYEGVETSGNDVKKYAGNIEDAIESFVKENSLKHDQYKMVKNHEEQVIQHTHNIVKKIQKCHDQEKNCVNIQSSVNSELGALDKEFDNLQMNARKFLKSHPNATMLSEKVNAEINQLSEALADFNEKVGIFMEQHK